MSIMNGGIMASSQMRAAAGYAPPALPFASFPAALTVEGQIRRPAELPHVELIAIGGVWRPRGGRQVLASRFINPVTVQNNSFPGAVAETIGPFPGGVVRAGMKLTMDAWIDHSGIGAGNRYAFWEIGADSAFAVSQLNLSNSGTDLNSQLISQIDVLADVGGPHRSLRKITGTYSTGATSQRALPFDFSQPWSTNFRLCSIAETAVTIIGATWSAGVATYTTSASHTLAVGDKDVISGITPSGWNGTFIVSAVGSPTTFSVPMAANPGTYTSGGSSSRISNISVMSYELALVG